MARYTQKTFYTIHWYKYGFCYRSTTHCDRQAVKDARELAKLLGEKIETEKEEVVKYRY